MEKEKAFLPSIFSNKVKVVVSTIDDGNMDRRFSDDADDNFRKFCDKFGIKKFSEIRLNYNRSSFREMLLANHNDYHREYYADGLMTNEKNHWLLIRVGDCCPVIAVDEDNFVVALYHQGRHAASDHALCFMPSKMDALGAKHGSIKFWLGPAVDAKTYPIYDRKSGSLHQIAKTDLVASGISSSNIESSHIDTARDWRFFSHSQAIKSPEEKWDKNDPRPNGRFIVAVCLTD